MFSMPRIIARAAFSAPALATYSIRKVVGMPSGAMGLSGVYSNETMSSEHVFLVCDRFKVGGINTSWSAAQVVEFKTFRDFAYKVYIGIPIC